ncbi:MAG: NAD(P)-dependent oxidoreductase [Pseudomonadota bacterium]|nr:NAD(P)-dependent oxidoreductase [Pseudomonadota bacterium]
MTILLFGASGFIGKAVLNQLISMHVEKIICVRQTLSGTEPFQGDGVEWHALDILAPDTMKLANFVEISDIVLNCTGELENTLTMTEINFHFVKRLTALLKASTKSHHFIQLSSVGCYGAVNFYRGQAKSITEDATERPAGLYETSKTQADDYIREQISEQTPNVSYTIIRPTNVFGKGMNSQALVGLSNIIKAGRFFYIGNQASISTYIIHMNVS